MRYFLTGNMHSCIQRLILSIFIFLAFNIVLSKSNETGIFYSAVFAQSCSPPLIGSYYTPPSANGVFVSGTTAYVAAQDAGFRIIDVSNPASPSLLGSYDTPGLPAGVFVSGTTAYVADWISGLQIIDVSNPASPSLLGSYDTPGGAWRVFVSGGTAYVADRTSGLQIIDVSNPASPSLLGSYDTPGWASGVYVSGSTAYVADGASGLQIIDVSNPASPSLLGSYDKAFARRVFVSGSTAYVAAGFSGLQIIDVSNPASPSLLGSEETQDEAMEVFVSGSTAYVADWFSGLHIIDVSSCAGTCIYTISPTSKSFGSTGGTGTVSVSDPCGLGWMATSNDPLWITITSASSGTGDRTVNYSVAANTNATSRTGTMTIAGKTFTVTQTDSGTNPTPDIKANGSDGPVTLTDNLSVTVSLDPGSRSGDNTDWWVAVDTPFGWYYFYASTMSWVYAGDSYIDLSPTHQGPLLDLSTFEVLNMTGLPEGTYTFYFAVDTNMNGFLDFGELYYDSVVVNITP